MSDEPQRQICTDEELVYSATLVCSCGQGMAYPINAITGKWQCSAVLKGVVDLTVAHSESMPFSDGFVVPESPYRGTTRGVGGGYV